MDVTDIINMFLLFVASIGSFLVFLQWRTDHKRSRQSFAVNLMMKWVDSLDNDSFGIRRFVESLDREQCERLEKAEEFFINESQLELALYVLKREFPGSSSISIDGNSRLAILNNVYSLFIRSNAVKWLNLIECIMAAWDQGFADKQIIEQEFGPVIFDKDERKIAMTYFRAVSIDGYPCLNKFIAHIERKRRSASRQSAEQKPLGSTSA